MFGQARQKASSDHVELAHVAEVERPQERAKRRRRPNPGEQPIHPAMPEQIHVADRVRASDHPRYQTAHLRPGRVTSPTLHGHMSIDQVSQPGPLRGIGTGQVAQQFNAFRDNHQIRLSLRTGSATR